MESVRRMLGMTSVWQLDTDPYGASRVATAIPNELIEAAQVGNAVRVRDWIWAGETRIVQQLLLAGANPQLRDSHQRTADDWIQLKQHVLGVAMRG
ncbi:hypothetical protein Ctob_003482 [Chrysochromulina tobinii]|uniref:Uncharacterized protein n=1 Tax=Chrysochromulina tobinii TaxID=1460289 RepID=A0A0M0JTC6_9EUKA|nr:hypothetical protein Ctob_003482 [Chrysochromulina tobinii]|eukprot:KOO29542.1 hypothetical protein Ctob_003482 [Chrysochromulina sp. CCMP291]